jgi:hypothetical protein
MAEVFEAAQRVVEEAAAEGDDRRGIWASIARESARNPQRHILIYEEYSEKGRQLSKYLRDLIGNPFRPASLTPSWLTPVVVNLAHAAYYNRILPSGLLDNGGLAILADALEEAGCDNADILSHLRGPGPHRRGCWPVDLLLGKK